MSELQTRPQIRLPMEQIEAYCRRWKITELALFGSVLTDRFRPDSDVDVLVTFEPHNSYNYIIRQSILRSAQVIYVA